MALTPNRRLLPMLGHTHGNRSASVCRYRCGDACAHPAPNPTETSYFPDVVAQVVSRRSVLAGSALAAFVTASGTQLLAGPPAAADAGSADGGTAAAEAADAADAARGGGRSIAFTPIRPVAATADELTVPAGWAWRPVIAWGDPVLPGAPAFDATKLTPQRQAGQFGYNNDYLTIIPLDGAPDALEAHTAPTRGVEHALLVANHEYYNPELMFPDWGTEATPDRHVQNLTTAMQSMGLSVVLVERSRRRPQWTPSADRRRNRRITPWTAFAVDGPAAGSDLLRTSADPTGRKVLGTVNNCSGGTTPWGTVLSGEENFNQYFRARTTPTAEDKRYGVTGAGSEWEKVDRRFDLNLEPNEANRFGWVIEVDPSDPYSTPVKHTALGRFKHEGATVQVARNGRVVAYLGDDERFDYVYKFVSSRTFDPRPGRAAREHNKRLLADGDLYVARFTGDGTADGTSDGTGEWLPIVKDGASMVPGFTVAQALVNTRLAADVLKPTKMDRPEDVQPNHRNGRVYIACTNNTNRGSGTNPGTDEPNPRPKNKDGHVIELIEDRGDATATTFTWNLVLVCGDPADTSVATYFGGWKGEVSPISCPDNLAFDAEGDLWIATDGAPSAIKYNDALHLVPLRGAERGRVQQFLSVPTGAETCGPLVDSEGQSVFVAVQHPGDTEGASYAQPSSRFPYLDDGFDGPRPAVVQVYRKA